MNKEDIKLLARAIAKEPLEKRINLIEQLLTDLEKHIKKKKLELERKYVI